MTEKAIKTELRLYSECYYAPLLEEAGFISYRNDMLNWYKLYNGIICHFHLLVTHSRFPLLMQAWWFHPTYVPAILNLPASWTNYDEINVLYANTAYFSSHTVERGCGVNIPNLPQIGAENLLRGLFPQIKRLQTREAVYKFRKEEILSWTKELKVELSSVTTPDFADEALVMQDSEMFAPCIDYIEAILPRAHHKSMQSSPFSRTPELLKAQLKALQGEDVDQYYAMLKERKASFLKRYKLKDEAFEL